MSIQKQNPLGVEKIAVLLRKFAVPSVIAMLVNAIYNVVDQLFIGNFVGKDGNAATTVTLPITTLGIAMGLLIGQGGASKQNLELGAGNKKKAEQSVGNVVILGTVASIILAISCFVFLKPLLNAFGATPECLPYAQEYARIIIVGIPFAVLGTCLNNSIRADASPMYAMISMAAGAITNILLDAVFVIGFHMGMTGAALATIIGQILTCIITLFYIPRYKHVTINKECFKFDSKIASTICALGMAPCINQLSMFISQIVLNNLMKSYGKASIYGSNTPIACMGIVMKVNMIFMAIVIGIAQGTQPIVSFNYGACNYKRCRSTYRKAARVVITISVCFFIIFQTLPKYIIMMFGERGNKTYVEFGILCFRIFLFMAFLNGIQPLTSVFFTSIGKANKGAFIALTRQIILLLPLAIILPMYFGIKGIMYAAPIADFSAFVLALTFVSYEFNIMRRQEKELQESTNS